MQRLTLCILVIVVKSWQVSCSYRRSSAVAQRLYNNSCISECIIIKCLAINQDELILRLVIPSKCLKSVLNFGQIVPGNLLEIIPADLLDNP